MPLSTHYYVLVLGTKANKLYEAFREYLIDIKNQGFPLATPPGSPDSFGRDHLLELAQTVDKIFDHYYMLEPLRLIVVGNRKMQFAFSAVTTHGSAVIGRVDGDHTATPALDLGQIVWPVIKEAMSGVLDEAMRDLEASPDQGRTACGLETVARLLNERVPTTLLVEDGYHRRGRIGGTTRSPVISQDVDVRETMDDAVDAVIERVLQFGGNVVFTPRGSLNDWDRIVLLQNRQEKS